RRPATSTLFPYTTLFRSGSSFSFIGASTNIVGALNLQNGSSISGGTGSNPINVQGNTGVAGGSTLGGNLNIAGQLSSSNSFIARSEEHTSELQSREKLVC